MAGCPSLPGSVVSHRGPDVDSKQVSQPVGLEVYAAACMVSEAGQGTQGGGGGEVPFQICP